MRIDRYKLSENSTIDMDDAGDWVPYIQVSRLLGTFTTRDRFAAAALTGNLASMNPGFIDEGMAQRVARGAYQMADAMMEARRK